MTVHAFKNKNNWKRSTLMIAFIEIKNLNNSEILLQILPISINRQINKQ